MEPVHGEDEITNAFCLSSQMLENPHGKLKQIYARTQVFRHSWSSEPSSHHGWIGLPSSRIAWPGNDTRKTKASIVPAPISSAILVRSTTRSQMAWNTGDRALLKAWLVYREGRNTYGVQSLDKSNSLRCFWQEYGSISFDGNYRRFEPARSWLHCMQGGC